MSGSGSSANAPPEPPCVVVGIDRVLVDDANGWPSNCASDINGGSSDLMKGHGGKYSYLGPKFERYSRGLDARTSLSITIQGDARSDGSIDLARGAGGDYIYLDEQTESDNPNKICEVRILRSGNAKNWGDIEGLGWNGMTGDVCRGRGGDYVYVIWKTVKVL